MPAAGTSLPAVRVLAVAFRPLETALTADGPSWSWWEQEECYRRGARCQRAPPRSSAGTNVCAALPAC